MHEASIVMGILNTVIPQCRKEGYNSIEAIRLRVGKASGIMPEALIFAFDIAKHETIASKAKLDIDIVPLSGNCKACGEHFEIEDKFLFNCPSCNAADLAVTKGYEMEIVEMDIN